MRMLKMSSWAPVRAMKPSLAQTTSPPPAWKTTTGRGVLSMLFLPMESAPPVMASMYLVTFLRRRARWRRW